MRHFLRSIIVVSVQKISLSFSSSPTRTAPKMTDNLAVNNLRDYFAWSPLFFGEVLFCFLVGDCWPLWAQVSHTSGHEDRNILVTDCLIHIHFLIIYFLDCAPAFTIFYPWFGSRRKIRFTEVVMDYQCYVF